VATGSWRASAQLKLAHAGLPEVHLVTASEESARPALIARAVREVLACSKKPLNLAKQKQQESQLLRGK
jgi:hypothetical protein